MVQAAHTNGQLNANAGICAQVVPSSPTRLRVRLGMVALYLTLLTLLALYLIGPGGWRPLAAALLPLNSLALYFGARRPSGPNNWERCGRLW